MRTQADKMAQQQHKTRSEKQCRARCENKRADTIQYEYSDFLSRSALGASVDLPKSSTGNLTADYAHWQCGRVVVAEKEGERKGEVSPGLFLLLALHGPGSY